MIEDPSKDDDCAVMNQLIVWNVMQRDRKNRVGWRDRTQPPVITYAKSKYGPSRAPTRPELLYMHGVFEAIERYGPRYA